MLNCSASLAMSTSVLKALPGKLDIIRHSPSILYISRCVISRDCTVVTLSIFSISEASMSFKFSSSRSLNALDIKERAS